MQKRFDATTRNLFRMNPVEWSAYLGHPVADPGRVQLIDSNLSTIAAEVDCVIRLEDPIPWLWNIEFQTGRDLGLAVRLHFYSTLLHHHYKLPVRTSLFLVRKVADGPELTGIHEMRYPGGDVYDRFRYDVVRLWEQPVEPILAAGLTVLPLAPVARVERDDVRGILAAVSERIDREATGDQVRELRTATTYLMGLRYSIDDVHSFIGGIPAMVSNMRLIEESSVYQDAVRKGEVQGRAGEARRILIRHGTRKFGPPDEQAKAHIAALADLDRLQDLIDRVLDVASWDELLAGAPEDPV